VCLKEKGPNRECSRGVLSGKIRSDDKVAGSRPIIEISSSEKNSGRKKDPYESAHSAPPEMLEKIEKGLVKKTVREGGAPWIKGRKSGVGLLTSIGGLVCESIWQESGGGGEECRQENLRRTKTSSTH